MTVRKNASANLAGRIWTALMSFAFVPLYIRLLGMEAYGLIGFFASMMAVFAILDLGLGLTVNRELARSAAQGGVGGDARDLFRTLEVVYWAIAAMIGIGIVLLAPLIVDHWLNIRSLNRNTAINGVRAMGFTALVRWPVSLYVGAMMGLQHQLRLNIVTSIFATLASAGVIVVLMLVSRTVTAFFLWQAVIAGCLVLTLRTFAWNSIALPGHRPRIRAAALGATLGFSAAVTGITLLSVILTQLDKFVLSRLLPLDAFGNYALAGAIAAVLTTAGAAVESATFPALSRLVAMGDAPAERRLYHQASQGLALVVVPVTMALVLFAHELLSAYVHDPAIVEPTYRLLSVLAAGNGLLALMFMPLSLQLANGWTRLSLYKNIVAVVAFVPCLYVLALHFGAIGAAFAWLILTTGYFLIEVPIMHRRLLPGAQWRWYGKDIGGTLLISLVILGTMRIVMPTDASLVVKIVLIMLATAAALVGSALALPSVRQILADRFAGGRQAQA